MEIQLIAYSDDLEDSLGLFIQGTENNERIYAVRNTTFLAHDVTDHYPMPEGTAADELRALGAILYGRGSYTYVALHYDVESSWDDLEIYGETLPEAQPHPDGEIMEEIHEVLKKCDLMDRDPDLIRLTVNLMAEGYMKAEKRWKHPMEHVNAYEAIKGLNFPELTYEGQLFTLTVSNNQSAQLTEIYE